MVTLNPYLSLPGNCREAMNFYKEIFGGELNIMTFADTPMADQMPPEMKNSIIHSMLKVSDSFKIMATEMTGTEKGPSDLIAGNNVSLTLVCESEAEIRELFSKLSTDAQAKDELQSAFWGGLFGRLTDKFGTHWMFEYSENAPQA